MAIRLLSRVVKKFLNAALHTLPSSLRRKAVSYSKKNSPIFIIGAPRVGSTIFYQLLTNELKVGYIDNLAGHFFGHLPFAVWLSHKLYSNSPHNIFYSEHGNTERYGGHAPSECGEFWYRWLAHSDHFIDYGEFNERTIKQLRAQVSCATIILGMPIVFKNLNNGQRLRLIHSAFPDARIIWCRRKPEFIVQSIINVRHRLGWPSSKIWSVRPKNWRKLEKLPEVSMVAEQVLSIEDQISQDIRLFPSDNIKICWFEEWYSSAEEMVKGFEKWIGVSRRPSAARPFLTSTINHIADQNLYNCIKSELNKRRGERD